MSVLTPERSAEAEEAPTTDPRIEARRAQVRASTVRRVRIGLLVVLAAVVAGVLGGAGLISPVLDVDRIVVLGAPDLEAERIADATGVGLGQAMYSVDPDTVAERVAELPEIRRATARVRWPDVVEVRVTPRRQVARVLGRDDVALTIGEGGVVLDESAILAVPVIEVHVAGQGPLAPGRRLAEPVRSAVEVAGGLPIAVRLRVGAAFVDEAGRLELERLDGGRILLGVAHDIADKLVAVESMLSGRVDTDGLCLLDVREPEAPVIRRRPDCDAPPEPAPVPAAVDPAAADPAAVDPTAPPVDPAAAPTPGDGAAGAGREWGSPGAPEPEQVDPEAPVEGT